MKNSILFCLLIFGFVLRAQMAISGHLNINEVVYGKKIQLAKLNLDHVNDLKFATPVTSVHIENDGSFVIDQKYLSDKDAVYHIYINELSHNLKDTIVAGTTFITSKYDKVIFQKSIIPFAEYVTTNKADKEWKKLQHFEQELFQSQLTQIKGENQLKNFTKDSLRILMVKLIGIKQLDKKGLLDQDINKNSIFYLQLLSEFKESEIPSENYIFLEQRLVYLSEKIIKEKYVWSKIINYVLVFCMLSLVVFLIIRKKRKPNFTPLSKQEKNIQNLIALGKTNKEIANELFISISTVKTHITNLYGKLKVSNRQELLQRMQN